MVSSTIANSWRRLQAAGRPWGCSGLKKIEKKFIIIGALLTALICGGFYINHQLNILAAAMSNAGLFLNLMPEDAAPLPEGTPGTPLPADSPPGTALGDGGTAKLWSRYDFNKAVQDKLNRPPAKKDLLKAGLIILRKFNREEIEYLYRVGTRGNCTKEELQRIREIILDTLTPQEIDTLREIGAKYGKELRFLAPDAG